MRLSTINTSVIREGKWDLMHSMLDLPILLKDGTTVTLMDVNSKVLKDVYSKAYDGLKHVPNRPEQGPKRDRLVWLLQRFKKWLAEELLELIPKQGHRWPSQFGVSAEPAPPEEQTHLQRVVHRLAEVEKTSDFVGSSRTLAYHAILKLMKDSHLGHYMGRIREFHYVDPNNTMASVVWTGKSWEDLKAELSATEEVMAKATEGKVINPCPGSQGEAGGAFGYGAQHPPHEAEEVVKLAGGWGWWRLHAPYCSYEGRSARHCGNVTRIGSSDDIISLRKKTKKAHIYESFMSFILQENGNLGEMKGKGNKKPPPKYHQHIATLMAQCELFRSAAGDPHGHAPSENFCLFRNPGSPRPLNEWTDLSDALAEELHGIRPEIFYYNGVCQYCSNVHGLRGECSVRGPLSDRPGSRRRPIDGGEEEWEE